MTISERIFYLLEKQGKKQSDLVRLLGVRPNTVSEWKLKNREPTAIHYAKLADFFGVSIDYLVTGKDPPFTAPIVNQSIIGNRNLNNTVVFNAGEKVEVSEYEGELLKIARGLDMRHKNALLSFAYELENKMKK